MHLLDFLTSSMLQHLLMVDNTAEERTWNGVEYEDEVEALDDNLDFFEIAWVEDTDEEVVLDNLDWVVAVL